MTIYLFIFSFNEMKFYNENSFCLLCIFCYCIIVVDRCRIHFCHLKYVWIIVTIITKEDSVKVEESEMINKKRERVD